MIHLGKAFGIDGTAEMIHYSHLNHYVNLTCNRQCGRDGKDVVFATTLIT